jgi:hypothetical protein
MCAYSRLTTTGADHARDPSVNVGTADLMRQNTVSNSSTRALPNEETFKSMMDGIVLIGYFQAPYIDEPIVQKMAVWYDLYEGTAAGNPANLVGKKGALRWRPSNMH